MKAILRAATRSPHPCYQIDTQALPEAPTKHPGKAAARTAIGYTAGKDEMYVFQGGRYTPDQIQDVFRGLGAETALLLDGGGSSAIVLRRDSGGMWAGAGSPRGNCDTMQMLCDADERALPAWLAFD